MSHLVNLCNRWHLRAIVNQRNLWNWNGIDTRANAVLTNRLVKVRAKRSGPGRQKAELPGSRSRILVAAAEEFAARGFAGAGVDRIARRARLNKAMIYYHFADKTALYREVLRDIFRAAGERVSAIARSQVTPDAKVRAFIAAMVEEALRRRHFPSILLRELAEDGRHLDSDTITLLQVMPRSLAAIVQEGVRAGRFRPINPLFAYMTVVGPLMFYFSSMPVRARIAREGLPGFEGADLGDVIDHVQEGALATLRRRRSKPRPTKNAVSGGDHV
jgi:AcrR family transcriptional regulator